MPGSLRGFLMEKPMTDEIYTEEYIKLGKPDEGSFRVAIYPESAQSDKKPNDPKTPDITPHQFALKGGVQD